MAKAYTKDTDDMLNDIPLNPRQKQAAEQMIAQGMDEREAKLRAITIAEPPDHFQRVPYVYEEYPRMVYHPDGRTGVAATAEDHAAARVAGWLDQPPSTAPREEAPAPAFEVHPGAAVAVAKRRQLEEKRKEKEK